MQIRITRDAKLEKGNRKERTFVRSFGGALKLSKHCFVKCQCVPDHLLVCFLDILRSFLPFVIILRSRRSNSSTMVSSIRS